jgi:hypothetical protein
MEELQDVNFAPNTTYEMIFSVFFKMSTRDKKEIFMITNEKQVKVPDNLLRMYKRELELLSDGTQIYDLVSLLNSEDNSPLKGRIKMGAKKIRKGYQESKISKIIKGSETYKKLLEEVSTDLNTMAKIISNYLQAWEKVYGVSYQEPGKDTITKISGLRYVFYVLPAMMDILKQRKNLATREEFRKIIEMIPDATKIDDPFTNETTVFSFRGETSTIGLAKDHASKLKVHELKHQDSFNIAEGI